MYQPKSIIPQFSKVGGLLGVNTMPMGKIRKITGCVDGVCISKYNYHPLPNVPEQDATMEREIKNEFIARGFDISRIVFTKEVINQ